MVIENAIIKNISIELDTNNQLVAVIVYATSTDDFAVAVMLSDGYAINNKAAYWLHNLLHVVDAPSLSSVPGKIVRVVTDNGSVNGAVTEIWHAIFNDRAVNIPDHYGNFCRDIKA